MENETQGWEPDGRLIPSARVRRYLYGIAVVVIPCLVAVGVVTDEVAAHIGSIAAAVLAVGTNVLAGANTPRG